MQLNRIGNLEQESDLIDLDELEREMESELEDDMPDAAPAQDAAQPAAPAAKAAPQAPTLQNTFIIANARGGKGNSKFMPQVQLVRSNFWPGQPFIAAKMDERKSDIFGNPVVNPIDSKFDKRLRQKPANDSKPKTDTVDVGPAEPSTPKSTRSRFARATVEALLSIGALPMQMLIELGRFRKAKENRFFSAERLERGLGQGNEDAERFAAMYPNLAKKKEPAPPSLGMK
jgi:hypothetical protein